MDQVVETALRRFTERLESHSPLSDPDRQTILELDGSVADWPARRDLARPGDATSYAMLVADGLVGRFDLMRSGSRQITALYLTGDMSDLHSVVVPSITWGLTVLSPSTIVRVPHAQLRALASTRPSLALAFWRETALDASRLAKWVANIGRKEAPGRICHLLCELGIRMEAAELGRRDDYELALTQEQVGDICGLTAVHVNRTLTTSGRITSSGSKITESPSETGRRWSGSPSSLRGTFFRTARRAQLPRRHMSYPLPQRIACLPASWEEKRLLHALVNFDAG